MSGSRGGFFIQKHWLWNFMHVFRKFVVLNDDGGLKKNSRFLIDNSSESCKVLSDLKTTMEKKWWIHVYMCDFPEWISIHKFISLEKLENIKPHWKPKDIMGTGLIDWFSATAVMMW